VTGGRRGAGASSACLATLCLPSSATGQDARRAFRCLIRQLHPDASGNTGSGERLAAVVGAYRELASSGFLDERPACGDRRNGQLLDVRI
jgi:hypothetical protein